MASSSSPSQPAVATTLLGLPDELLGQRIVAHPALDPAARLAVFRSCHALARMLLLHAPSGKRVTHHVSSKDRSRHWSQRTAALARLLASKWQPLPPHLDLELCLEPTAVAAGAVAPARPEVPSLPPPSSIAQHISRLTLRNLRLTAADLAAWQLHDLARWPHLQHLTVQLCGLPKAATVSAAPPLPPIPHLQSFTWEQGNAQDVAALLPLAFNAERARLAFEHLSFADSGVGVLHGLQRLMYLQLDTHVRDGVLRALLQHPTLAHVVLGSLYFGEDHSRQPCRWRTLSVARALTLDDLSKLPLAGLERLTIGGGLYSGSSNQQQSAEGLAALQRLHGQGKLVLRPDGDAASTAQWGLSPDDELFTLTGRGRRALALLRLVVEAGQDVNALGLSSRLPLPFFRAEVAPLLEGQGTGIHTLCVDLEEGVTDEWCAGFLSALPACIDRVHVCVFYTDVRFVSSLVRGGVEGIRHPLTLTLLHLGEITAELEAELRGLVAGGWGAGAGGGMSGQAQPGALLTLKIVQTR